MTEWTVVAGVDSSATASEIDTVANNIANVNIVGGISSDVTTVAGIASDVTSVSSISGNVTTVAGIDSNVTTVAGISGEITTVANDGTDIGIVAANTSNINTVAGISSNVTTVAGISSDVTTVAADETDIGTVATNIANINTTAGSISNVNTVATNIANVNTVAADGTDIGVVAGISSDVTTVSGINANVTTVAGISADVTSVAGDATDIGTVATNIANVNTTAGSIANVNTVATDISNVNSVASNSTNINAVAANETNINAVNSNSTNINTVASNNTNITTVATDIANVNTTASNITGVNSFAERYRVDSSDPTTSLDAGDLAFNTTDSALKYYNGTSWASITAGLTDIVGDVTPQLGGNLDLNSNDITGTGNIDTTGNLTISGDLTVNGTTTTINSTTISVDDKNIELGATASPTDLTADGGGITLKGTTDHTLNWINSTDAWTSSEHLNLATGKEYKINNTSLKDVSETLTNKTINSASNTITITESNISDLGSYLENVVEDTTPQLGGDLSTNGNDVNFGDNDKAQFGAGNDLQIYHDGSNSYVKENGVGNFYIQGQNSIRLTNSDGTENYAIFNVDGAVQLNHDNATRLLTTSTGVDVTGTVVSDGLTVDTNTLHVDATNNIVGIGTSNPSTYGGILNLTDGSVGGETTFVIANNNANQFIRLGVKADEAQIAYDNADSLVFGESTDSTTSGITTERMRITSTGNVGIGTSSPQGALEVVGGATIDSGFSQTRSGHPSYAITNGGTDTVYHSIKASGSSTWYSYFEAQDDGTDINALKFNTGAGTEAMRIDSSGRLGIGTSSPDQNLHVSDTSTNAYIKIISNDSNTAGILFGDQNSGLQGKLYYLNNIDAMRFDTNGSERMRINSGGDLLVSKTTGNSTTTEGASFDHVSGGNDFALRIVNTNSSAVEAVMLLNRQNSDGGLITFRQANTTEGSISVSGTTVSYNGGHLSRWGRLSDNSKPTILKGTIMSNLDEMVVWSYDDVLYTEEDELPVDDDGNPTASVGDVKTPAYTAENEQRNQLKVSDVEGDINVAGLFVKWDTGEDGYNDIDLAMTGDMVIRIAQGTTVQRGDLLMSAGDGTAKPQEDDIVRSKTIAKVTSTTVINTYDDGSYVVPCVVMAC
jgi:hypothetical protein